MSAGTFAIPYEDFDAYTILIVERKERVMATIKETIELKDLSDWYTLFSLLCEYQSVLYHFEEVLESVTLGGEVDTQQQRWLIDQDLATKLSVYIAAERICRRELNHHNLSFSSH